MMFYKLLKILAHLHFLKEICNEAELDTILQFMGSAYQNTKDQLSFLFVMKVLLLITKDHDNTTLFNSSKYFQQIIDECYLFLKKHYLERSDMLTLEILLYLVNFFK